MRLLNAIKQDIQFQLRHGFYYAYGLVTIIYIVLMRMLPVEIRSFAATFIIFTDPAVLGAFFIGGIVLLEKGQGVLQHLFITPLRVKEYVLSKVISLMLLSLLSSLAIVVSAFGLDFNILLFILAVALSSIFFTLAGLLLAVRVNTVNEYIYKSILYFTVLFAPLLALLNIYDTPIFYFMPTNAALTMIKGIFTNSSIKVVLAATLMLLIWVLLAYSIAEGQIKKHIIRKNGGA